MSTTKTRAIDIKTSDGFVLGKAVWAWGECTIITTIESWRETRLDTDNDIAIGCIIHCIKYGDPTGEMEWLWEALTDHLGWS